MNQPFLPEAEALPAATKKGNGKKTLVLWVILIVMFLTIWQFLTPAERPPSGAQMLPPPPPAAAEACSSSFWSSSVVAIIPVAFVFLMFVLFMRAYRQNNEFQLAQEPGRIAMAQRRFFEAVELFRGSIPRVAKQPIYRALAVLDVANALVHAGRFDEALASCAEIERPRMFFLGSALRTRVATLTAFVYGLRGDIPTAERWAADARLRISKHREGDRLFHAGQLCTAEAVIACRKGDHTGAISLLDKSWNEMRYSLTTDAMRLVEVVRAFAEAQAGLRASNTVAERLVRVEPVSPGELAFLGLEWPEMKAFLGAHGFLGDPAASTAAAS